MDCPRARCLNHTVMLHFTKMNGAGNDFVLLDNRDGKPELDKASIARLCDRHRGVGADGLLVVEPARNGADFRMRYYNSDGGEAEMCGNGARCFARFAQKISGGTGDVSFETLAGVISAKFIEGNVQIQMSDPHSLALHQTIQMGKAQLVVHSLNTGVPHAAIFVGSGTKRGGRRSTSDRGPLGPLLHPLRDDLAAVDVKTLGRALRFDPHFQPKGTNVNFVEDMGHNTIAIRTYERGVEDETLACGTGMVACALIFHELTQAASPVQVRVRSGETLEVAWQREGAAYRQVTLTGPADFTFEGEIAL
jgi:diaminopimelate epimerase